MSTDTKAIYLDYAAATPLDRRVHEAMQPFFHEHFYNPSAIYKSAQEVRSALADARRQIAMVLGAHAQDIFFTAGATESINLAIYGVMNRYGGTVVTSAIEHEAVLAAVKRHDYRLVNADERGYIDPEAVRAAITDETTLVSIGYVNNELGTVQSLKAIAADIAAIRARRLDEQNDRPLLLHTDASQAAGILDLSVSRINVDMMTLNAAKCYGPKQVGLLWRSASIELLPLIVGGGQEHGVRSGTENVPGVIGFATALQLAHDERKAETGRLEKMRKSMIEEIKMAVPDVIFNGHHKRYAPHILHMSFPGLDGERVIYALDQRGVMAATGSACAANRATGSHVLKHIGMDQELANGSLRVSFGRYTTREDITHAVGAITDAVNGERGL